MRLDRILANSGFGTRSQIKKLIRSGGVSVEGVVVLDPSTVISKERISTLAILGQVLMYSEYIYLCLNKPDCCLTARDDPRLPTVQQFIPDALRGKGISPVGRLDYHTTGVLLLTNDGELNHRMTSPKYHLPKAYTVTFSGPPIGTDEIERFAAGFVLSDRPGEKTVLAPAHLFSINENRCNLIIREGRTHQVRRMMASIGREVISLHRYDFVGIQLLPNQMPGELRELMREEVQSLKSACGL